MRGVSKPGVSPAPRRARAPIARRADPAARRLGGDAEELGALCGELAPRLHAAARRIVRDPEAASDVVQNAFVKMVRRRHQYAGRARVSTWAHRIVVNEALMWLRAERARGFEKKLPLGEVPEPLDPAPSPAEDVARFEQHRRVRGALARLPRSDRDLLTHTVLEGGRLDAWARRHGLGEGAAKSRAFRARRRLRELLDAP